MIELHADDRGIVWADDMPGPADILVSNPHPLTLRGIHWQEEPHDRSKLVTVVSGACRFVTVNLDTGTFLLFDMKAGDQGYVRPGQACGYLTLEPNTVIFYEISGHQNKRSERGIRFDDPFFKFDWGHVPAHINDRDRNWPDWKGPKT